MKIAFLIYICFTCILCSLIYICGPIEQYLFGHDIFGLLEGGWKITFGYRPYVDFYTLNGPLSNMVTALGILLVGPTVNALPAAIIVTMIPLSIFIWYLLSSRLSPFITLIGSTCLITLWSGPYPLHFSVWAGSYAALYNRQSYVLLCLLFITLAVNVRSNLYAKGFLLGLLLFFKIPYFISGVILTGFYLLFSRISRKEFFYFIAGFFMVVLPMTVYLDSYLGYYNMFVFVAMAAKTRTPDVYAQTLHLIYVEFPQAVACILGAVFCTVLATKSTQDWGSYFSVRFPDRLKLIIEPCIVLVAALLAEMGSCPLIQFPEIPILCIYALLLIERIRRHSNWSREGTPLFALVGIGFCLVFILPLGIRSSLGVVIPVYLKFHPLSLYGSDTINAPGSNQIKIYGIGGKYPDGITYVDKINDGIGLIRKHTELDHSIIATLDFTDPFSFSLQRPSPPHMPLAIQYGFNVNENIAPDPEQIFKGSQALMIPKWPEGDERINYILLEKYHAYISSHFIFKDKTSQWTLMVRNQE